MAKNELRFETKMWAIVWPKGTSKEYRKEQYADRPRSGMPVTFADDLKYEYRFPYKQKGKRTRWVLGAPVAVFYTRAEARCFQEAFGYKKIFVVRPLMASVRLTSSRKRGGA